MEPPRISLVKKLIGEGRLHKRTIVHKEPSSRTEVISEFAREVNQFLRGLARVNPAVRR